MQWRVSDFAAISGLNLFISWGCVCAMLVGLVSNILGSPLIIYSKFSRTMC